MGVTVGLKRIKPSTLEILKKEPKQAEQFHNSHFMHESVWDRASDWAGQSDNLHKQITKSEIGKNPHRQEFIAEWEIPFLDLHKHFSELTYLLAGYVDSYSERDLALPELQARPELMQQHNFMNFLMIEDSEWDGLPLVNAIWWGTQLVGNQSPYWYQTADEVAQLAQGLEAITEAGFKARYQRESESENPCPLFEWPEYEEDEEEEWEEEEYQDEELACWVAYYNYLLSYYQAAVRDGNAMLVHLSA